MNISPMPCRIRHRLHRYNGNMPHPVSEQVVLAELAQRIVFNRMGHREELIEYGLHLVRHNRAPCTVLIQEPGGITTRVDIPVPDDSSSH